MTALEVQQELNAKANPVDVEFLQRFFKTGKGQYGEGDVFLGLRVPVIRKIAAKYQQLPIDEIEKLLESPIHEHRLAAVIIMAEGSKRAGPEMKQQFYNLYLNRTDRINNWDIVDVSCRDVIGGFLMDKPRDELYRLAASNSIWERRIAMVSTWHFIRVGQLDDTFRVAELLMHDTQDLIHKAAGWMLREAGKKDEGALLDFLDRHANDMPRTMLRYSLERLEPELRERYMRLPKKTVK